MDTCQSRIFLGAGGKIQSRNRKRELHVRRQIYIFEILRNKELAMGTTTPYTTQSPSPVQLLHRSEFVIAADRHGVEVYKNRFNNKTGNLSTEELINILTRMLTEHIFQGRMKVFQEAMHQKMKEALMKIVKEGA